METEKGVAIIAFKEIRASRRFLVLKRKKNWDGWEIPKGHLEEDNYVKTAKTELNEEAAIKNSQIESIEDLEADLEWSFERNGEEIKREYKGFIVKVSGDANVDTTNNPNDEHETGFFMKKEDVKSLLTYENQEELLEEAIERLER